MLPITITKGNAAMTNKEKIKAKIEALLAKTTENGATEAEAMAAAEKAASLMLQYEIEAGEIGIRAEAKNCKAVWANYSKYGKTAIARGAAVGVAKLFDCRVWEDAGVRVAFFGLEKDVEIAGYVFACITNAILAETETYKISRSYHEDLARGYHGKTLVTSFLAGIERRIYVRLVEMARQKDAERPATTGASLVVVKDQVVSEEFSKLGINLGRAQKSKRTIRSHGAYAAGDSAGQRVSINKGVASGTRALLV